MFRGTILMMLLALGASAQAENKVTVIVDAFSRKPELSKDWGYSALVEYNGKRILFDTGDDIAIFRSNVDRLHVNLKHLDAVVISHSHGDHTSGLRYVLAQNPTVPVYFPDDPLFRPREVPRAFLTTTPEPALEKDHRYFDGAPAEHIFGWQAYSDVKATIVKQTMTIMPGVRLVTLCPTSPRLRDWSRFLWSSTHRRAPSSLRDALTPASTTSLQRL